MCSGAFSRSLLFHSLSFFQQTSCIPSQMAQQRASVSRMAVMINPDGTPSAVMTDEVKLSVDGSQFDATAGTEGDDLLQKDNAITEMSRRAAGQAEQS